MILQRHPVRKQFGNLPIYFDHKGAAVSAVDEVLAQHGWTCDFCSFTGDNGRATVSVLEIESQIEVGQAVFAWYRMPSGRYEFTIYLA